MKLYQKSLLPLVPPIYTEEDIHFNEWLAGFIDGDGHLEIQGNFCRLSVPQGTWNLHLIQLLQSKFGGKLNKVPSGINTHRYDLTNEDGQLIELAHAINGNVRGKIRTEQFIKLCNVYNINYIMPKLMSLDNAYTSGLIDSDGSITCQAKKIQVKVTATHPADLQYLKALFNGNITRRLDLNCAFDWKIGSQADVLFLKKYLLSFPLKSNKIVRANLFEEYYRLKGLGAWKETSFCHSEWLSFLELWYDNGNDQYRKDCKERPYTALERAKREAEGGGKPGEVEAATAGGEGE